MARRDCRSGQASGGALEYPRETYLELGRAEEAKAVLDRLERACKQIAVGFTNGGWGSPVARSGRPCWRSTTPTSRRIPARQSNDQEPSKRDGSANLQGMIRDAPALPHKLSEDTRLYLRPLGLLAGRPGHELMASGRGRWLAGGPLAFELCEVTLRRPGVIERLVAPISQVGAWRESLAPSAGARVADLCANLVASRDLPGEGGEPLLMGIVNVTPDSFSDGGAQQGTDAAVAQAARLAEEGATILDVGGESTRPGAAAVDAAAELARVQPVLQGIAGLGLSGITLSIDTRKASVMEAALAAGAGIINDVSALTHDPASLALAAGCEAAVVLMHMAGEPETMNLEPGYEDAPLDVFDYLEARIAACLAAGIARERLIVDPGIAFGKDSRHNLAILERIALYHGLGCPILLGVSRKGLTADMEETYAPKDRWPGSLAASLFAVGQGVQILRVHDVAAMRQALDVWRGIVTMRADPEDR